MPNEEKKETTEQTDELAHKKIAGLEEKYRYMQGEIDGLEAAAEARAARRKQAKKELTIFLLGFTYAMLLVYIIAKD